MFINTCSALPLNHKQVCILVFFTCLQVLHVCSRVVSPAFDLKVLHRVSLLSTLGQKIRYLSNNRLIGHKCRCQVHSKENPSLFPVLVKGLSK